MKRFLSAYPGVGVFTPMLATSVLAASLLANQVALATPSAASTTGLTATLSARQDQVQASVSVPADPRACAVLVWVTRPGADPVWRLAGFTSPSPSEFTTLLPAPNVVGSFTVAARMDCTMRPGVRPGALLASRNLTRVFTPQLTPTQVFPDAFDPDTPRRAEVRVSTVPGVAVSTRVTRPDGTVKTFTSTRAEVAAGTHKVGVSSRDAGRWRFEHTLTTPSATYTYSQSVQVHRSWAPLAVVNSRPVAFPSCSLTYAYDDSKAPARTRHMRKDVEAAFASASKASGIKFTPAPTSQAQILIRFDSLDKYPPSTAALGGARWTGSQATSGTVRISTTHPLMRTSSPARRGVLIHELGHVLGLGHVRLAKALMYPTTSPSSPTDFTPLDRTGLTELYGTCQ